MWEMAQGHAIKRESGERERERERGRGEIPYDIFGFCSCYIGI
jgi:hypothetical protein